MALQTEESVTSALEAERKKKSEKGLKKNKKVHAKKSKKKHEKKEKPAEKEDDGFSGAFESALSEKEKN